MSNKQFNPELVTQLQFCILKSQCWLLRSSLSDVLKVRKTAWKLMFWFTGTNWGLGGYANDFPCYPFWNTQGETVILLTTLVRVVVNFWLHHVLSGTYPMTVTFISVCIDPLCEPLIRANGVRVGEICWIEGQWPRTLSPWPSIPDFFTGTLWVHMTEMMELLICQFKKLNRSKSDSLLSASTHWFQTLEEVPARWQDEFALRINVHYKEVLLIADSMLIEEKGI